MLTCHLGLRVRHMAERLQVRELVAAAGLDVGRVLDAELSLRPAL